MADHTGPSSSFSSIENQEFDVIIIGGGTAGLVVANRLTEDENTRVLVIEAGGDRKNDPRVYTPGLMSQLYGDPEVDWDYVTPPQVSTTTLLFFRWIHTDKGEGYCSPV
jgi:choline dehydrogenase-like flavoprotein